MSPPVVMTLFQLGLMAAELIELVAFTIYLPVGLQLTDHASAAYLPGISKTCPPSGWAVRGSALPVAS